MTSITIPGGLLVAIEGIDGAGKSTLAKGLTDLLAEAGFAVSTSKEPTAGRWGMKLRESAQSGRLSPAEEVEYLLRDRREHVERVITPGLERGEVVILDRYFPSMVAYQGAAGLPVEELLSANDFAPRPHLLLLLDLSPSVGLQRIASRGDKPNHFESEDNLEKCRAIFLSMSAGAKRIVDASRPEAEVLIDAVALLSGAIASRLSVAAPGATDNIDKVNALMMAHSG